MKRLFVLIAFLSMLLTSELKAEGEQNQYHNWIWLGSYWFYVGDGDPEDPPVIPPIKK